MWLWVAVIDLAGAEELNSSFAFLVWAEGKEAELYPDCFYQGCSDSFLFCADEENYMVAG